MIKKIMAMICGAALLFIIGAWITVPVNIWYADTYLGGEDHTGQIFRFNVYVLWPLFVVAGALLGHRIHATFMSNSNPPRSGE